MSIDNPYISHSTGRNTRQGSVCYHCGAECLNENIVYNNQLFCCEGCKLVYELLADKGLCNYYNLQDHPGLKHVKALRKDKYAYLDDTHTSLSLLNFTDGKNAVVTFFIPSIHCSSCMWLLEHLHLLNEGIKNSRINFSAKEVTIGFLHDNTNLRKIVELLATIGYEPQINSDSSKEKTQKKKINKNRLYKLGVAGFCFGNIMLMSFPEYLSGQTGIDQEYVLLFRGLNLLLSIPVVLYAASEFFYNAWKGLQQKTLNIDDPIALAIIITYSRSIYEILTGIGGGYLDSMSGIVFFMLVGRVVQERTYGSLSFHRDYKAYFPMAATVVKNGTTFSKPISELEVHDVVQVYNEEIIPADGKVLSTKTSIDYSFVTGENNPVTVKQGETVYAGGKQLGTTFLMEVLKPVSSSYLTSLWNHNTFSTNKAEKDNSHSFIHLLSRHFSIVLFILAAVTAIYWSVKNPAMILPSVSAMLIVACPCALLLTATYTNGNLLRILSNNGLYLRDADVIQQLAETNHIVFDKTGTLTVSGNNNTISGLQLSTEEMQIVYSVAKNSSHPKSRQLVLHIGSCDVVALDYWEEVPGKGILANCNGHEIRIGSAAWVNYSQSDNETADVYINIDGRITAVNWKPQLREGVTELLDSIRTQYKTSLLSGDNSRHAKSFEQYFNADNLHFNYTPEAKLNFIAHLQKNGQHVTMLGDGLNDAGALQQSNVGITLADDINNFSPSCDAILQAEKIKQLPAMLKLSKWGRHIIKISFIISIIYNIIGISISATGNMNPMIAAILMPLSTLTIVLITTGASSIVAKKLHLN